MLFISSKGSENVVPKMDGRYLLTAQHLGFVTEAHRDSDVWLFCDEDSVTVEVTRDFWRIIWENGIWFLPDFHAKESSFDLVEIEWNDGKINIISEESAWLVFESWVEKVEKKKNSLNILSFSCRMTTSTGQAPVTISPEIAGLMKDVQNNTFFIL